MNPLFLPAGTYNDTRYFYSYVGAGKRRHLVFSMNNTGNPRLLSDTFTKIKDGLLWDEYLQGSWMQWFEKDTQTLKKDSHKLNAKNAKTTALRAYWDKANGNSVNINKKVGGVKKGKVAGAQFFAPAVSTSFKISSSNLPAPALSVAASKSSVVPPNTARPVAAYTPVAVSNNLTGKRPLRDSPLGNTTNEGSVVGPQVCTPVAASSAVATSHDPIGTRPLGDVPISNGLLNLSSLSNVADKTSVVAPQASQTAAISDESIENRSLSGAALSNSQLSDGLQRHILPSQSGLSDRPSSHSPYGNRPIHSGPLSYGPLDHDSLSNDPFGTGPLGNGHRCDGPIHRGSSKDDPISIDHIHLNPVMCANDNGPIDTDPVIKSPVERSSVAYAAPVASLAQPTFGNRATFTEEPVTGFESSQNTLATADGQRMVKKVRMAKNLSIKHVAASLDLWKPATSATELFVSGRLAPTPYNLAAIVEDLRTQGYTAPGDATMKAAYAEYLDFNMTNTKAWINDPPRKVSGHDASYAAAMGDARDKTTAWKGRIGADNVTKPMIDTSAMSGGGGTPRPSGSPVAEGAMMPNASVGSGSQYGIHNINGKRMHENDEENLNPPVTTRRSWQPSARHGTAGVQTSLAPEN